MCVQPSHHRSHVMERSSLRMVFVGAGFALSDALRSIARPNKQLPQSRILSQRRRELTAYLHAHSTHTMLGCVPLLRARRGRGRGRARRTSPLTSMRWQRTHPFVYAYAYAYPLTGELLSISLLCRYPYLSQLLWSCDDTVQLYSCLY